MINQLQFFRFIKRSIFSDLNTVQIFLNKPTITFITLFSFFIGFSQSTQDTIPVKKSKELKGVLLDIDKNTALPYANIVFLHKNTGIVTNEQGQYLLDITKLNKNDTISFQYIGYETKNLTIQQLDSSAVVYLKENTNSLNEIFVFSKNLNPELIVKKVLENKDVNYKRATLKNQTFIRRRFISDIDHIKINFKKSSFQELSKEKIEMVERKIPKHSVSYTDFLGNLYFSDNKTDSLRLKIDPIKMVSLKDKNLADMEQLETIFENLLSNTKEKEYWKIKSGIIGAKLQINENELDKAKRDSLKRINEMQFKTKYYRNSINYLLKYSTFSDKKEWDFLHRTSRYEYTLVGGTTVNGEDVYIIDFVPKNSGKFKGRVFITLKTYALIRADYEYETGKMGTDIHLFGVGYSDNSFSGSISFEKKQGTYQLKYCSKKEGSKVSVDRNISLIRKKKRFLLDKKLNEIKVGFNLAASEEFSFEMLVLDHIDISLQQFNDFKQKEFIKLIYVEQFNDQLWKGYSIIEPTKQMREYKKLEE